MYPRHRLDIGVADVLWALPRCVLGWGGPRTESGLVLQSVRSAWDLLLDALALPAGSEVVCSAVTHPDMARIARLHGLAIVPVDIDLDTLAPDPAALERAITERTRIVLVAHLFGGELDLGPIAEPVRRAGALLVEDRAQAFDGDLRGDPRADVALFSFGTLKTATALGGAIALVRDAALRERMRALEARWPVQPRAAYAAKLVRTLGLLVASHPAAFGALVAFARRAGRDVDRLLSESVRGFPAEEAAFRAAIRQRPCAPLRALLGRRLARLDRARLDARRAIGEQLAVDIERAIRVVGRRARRRTHWLFPVMAEDPSALVRGLRGAGFDASRSTSAITAIAGEDGVVPPNAALLIAQVVFLPAYPELPAGALHRLVGAVAGSARDTAAHARSLP